MDKLVLAIDQGTTGTTAFLVDRSFKIVHKASFDFEQIFPKPGYVEHRGQDILKSIEMAVTQVLAESGYSSNDIACIGLTNQRETTGLFDRQGKLVHNFIVWQCRRTAQICDALKANGHEQTIRELAGLVLDPYFSATKLVWLFEQYKGTRERALAGDLLFGTIDSYVLHHLTGGLVHATDATNASRTMLMNIETTKWDERLLAIFDVPRQCLPEIKSSSEVYGYTRGLPYLKDGIPISGLAGDQQAALFGQACFESGEAKITFGTGAFLLIHTGKQRVASQHGLLTSVALKLGEETTYCLEGSAFVAGAAVQWLRDGLKLIKTTEEVEALAREVQDSAGVDFVPALAGLGAPHWRPEARGVLCGVSRGTTGGHIAHAVLEGVALQNLDIIEAVAKDGVVLSSLKVDGGASTNDLLMQMQADYLNVVCVRAEESESTGLGVAVLAGLSVGYFNRLEDWKDAWRSSQVFHPQMEDAGRENRIARWRQAVLKA